MELKDSGNSREFNTGAVRDIAEGKGRCDLLPLGIIGNMLVNPILIDIEHYIRTGKENFLESAISEFARSAFGNIETALLEVSKHYEDGQTNMRSVTGKKASHFIAILIVALDII